MLSSFNERINKLNSTLKVLNGLLFVSTYCSEVRNLRADETNSQQCISRALLGSCLWSNRICVEIKKNKVESFHPSMKKVIRIFLSLFKFSSTILHVSSNLHTTLLRLFLRPHSTRESLQYSSSSLNHIS